MYTISDIIGQTYILDEDIEARGHELIHATRDEEADEPVIDAVQEANTTAKLRRLQQREDIVGNVNDIGNFELPKRMQPQTNTKLRARKNDPMNYLKMKNKKT